MSGQRSSRPETDIDGLQHKICLRLTRFPLLPFLSETTVESLDGGNGVCTVHAQVLLRLTAQLLGAGKLDEQQVHAGTTEAQILDALDSAEQRAREQQENRKDGSVEQMVVQFWDEADTCP